MLKGEVIVKSLFLILSIFFLAPSAESRVCPRAWSEAISGADQVIVMTGDGWNSATGELRLLRRENVQSAWVDDSAILVDRRMTFGEAGFAWGEGFTEFRSPGQPVKKEGDKRSPVGVFKLGTRFGFAASSSTHYLQILPSTECVDDPRSRHYNRIVDARKVQKDWRSSEKMRRISVYEHGIHILYNPKQVKSAGSCIFLHYWESALTGTAGCGAMNPPDMLKLHEWLGESKTAAAVLIPREEYPLISGCFPL